MPMFFRENESPAPWRRARDTGEEALSALKRDRVTASLFYPTGFQFPPDYEFNNTVSFADTIAADAAVTLGSTLAVTGASTLTGNTTVGGTLGVTGVATFTASPVVPDQGTVTAPSSITVGASFDAGEQAALQACVDALRSLLPKLDTGLGVITAA